MRESAVWVAIPPVDMTAPVSYAVAVNECFGMAEDQIPTHDPTPSKGESA